MWNRFAFAVCAVLVAGCAASPSLSPVIAPDGALPAGGPSSQCKNPPGYAFGGPCTSFTLTQSGGTASVPANSGYQLAFVFPANDIPKNLNIALGTATYAQIGKNPGGQSMPQYPNAFLYFVTYSPRTTAEFVLHGNPRIVITAKNGFPGTTCSAAAFVYGAWTRVPFKLTVAGNKLTLTMKLVATNVEKGKTYAAFACR